MNLKSLREVLEALLIFILYYYKIYFIISQINQATTSKEKQAYFKGEMIENWQPREASF